MPTTNNNAPSPWAIRSVANFRYFMREGGLGLLLVVIFGITAFIQHVYDAVFQFPPDWLPVLRLMLPLVAFTTWTTVRVWMFKSNRWARGKRGFDVVPQEKPATTAPSDAPQEKSPAAGSPAHHAVVHRSHRKTALLSWTFVIAGIGCFFAYFVCSSQYTLYTATTTQNGTSPRTGPVYVLPLWHIPAFEKSLKERGGMSYVVDNDWVWLEDQLKEGEVAEAVLCTKIMLMALLLVATLLLTVGTTLLTFLPKRNFTPEDAIEAGGPEAVEHFHAPH
jgi:hypothetical protein